MLEYLIHPWNEARLLQHNRQLHVCIHNGGLRGYATGWPLEWSHPLVIGLCPEPPRVVLTDGTYRNLIIVYPNLLLVTGGSRITHWTIAIDGSLCCYGD
jgi:hypothetical protein